MKKEDNQCNGKIKYETQEEANKFSSSLNKKSKDRVKSYRCSTCDGWHFGHEGKKTKMPIYKKVKMSEVNHKPRTIKVDPQMIRK